MTKEVIDPNNAARIDMILTRCADQQGDITQAVMDRFYSNFPSSRADFERLYPGRPHDLEGEMIQEIVFGILRYFTAPLSLRIILNDTIPHHLETLKVDIDQFRGLLGATIEIIRESIPREDSADLDAFAKVEQGINGMIDRVLALSTSRLLAR